MTAISAEVITALGRLNTHARAYGFGKDAIYSYKTLAATTLGSAGELKTRGIEWKGKCSICGGTGRYWYHSPDDTEPCRRCSATGQVTLHFIETTLPDGQVWHHPFPDNYCVAQAAGLCHWSEDARCWQWPDERWNPAGQWRPLLPAEKLSADEAAGFLNQVEAWVDGLVAAPRGDSWWWIYEGARRAALSYALDLGRTAEHCFVCGQKPHIGIGHLRRLLHWSVPVCKFHHEQFRAVGTRPDRIPPEVITPAIELWLNRRGWDPADRSTWS